MKAAGIAKSVYHYWKIHLETTDQKDSELVQAIKNIVTTHKGRTGYRRVTVELKLMGYRVNHKKVLRLMKENKLLCVKFKHRNRAYKSYKGQLGRIAKNKINRRFISDRPYQKLLTDVTQFSILNGRTKLYMSTVMDVCTKEIISYSISESPDMNFVLESLDKTIDAIPELPYRTTIHSDQGWHYQNKKWIKRLTENNIFQSMSRKGNCLDNSPMENFFAILKQEMFYGEKFSSFNELAKEIADYIHYYNHIRRKNKIKDKTPVEYRNLVLMKLV